MSQYSQQPQSPAPTPVIPLGQAELLPPPAPRKRRGLFWWIFFIALAVILFVLLQKDDRAYQKITLDSFVEQLEAGHIHDLTVFEDEVTGSFREEQPVGYSSAYASKFRTALPANLSGDWAFQQVAARQPARRARHHRPRRQPRGQPAGPAGPVADHLRCDLLLHLPTTAPHAGAKSTRHGNRRPAAGLRRELSGAGRDVIPRCAAPTRRERI
jgi:hypothetical protein